MAGKDKKPEIRFTGFTDTWEQRKFEDNIVSIQTGTNLLGAETNNGIPLLKMGNIQRGFFSLNKLEYLDAKEQVEKENIVQYGDFLFNTRNTLELVGKGATWTGKGGKYAFNSNIARFAFNGVNTLFFNYLYNTQDMINQVHARAVGTTSVAAVYPKSLNSLEYMLPKVEEQKKIGELLLNIDNFITLHHRKYDKLVIVKKSMLKKMFPKDEANVPEIRFAGFTDAWEQRELSDYLDTSNEKNSNDDFSKSDVLSVSGDLGIINQIEFHGRSFAGASVSNYGIVDNGDVVYTKSPLKANPYGIIKTNKGKPGIVSTLYAVYKPKKNANSNFVQCYFDYDYRLNKYLKPLVNKGAKNDMKVSDDNALTGLVIFPSYEEQTRIAEFLECFDNLISLHQRELEKLKNIKKSMLEKMFV